MSEFRLFWHRVGEILLYSPTTKARGLLALTAGFWSLGLMVPGETFVRPTYAVLREIFGPSSDFTFASLFGFYAVWGFWRAFSSISMPTVALVFNSFGVVLFTAYPFSVLFSSLHPFPAGIAADLTMMFLSLWVLIRTQVNSPDGWRGD